eukprot:3940700-Rhodomonas_salina.4
MCHYNVHDLVNQGVMTLVKCVGTHNIADALTKSLPGPSWTLHEQFLSGSRQEYKAFLVQLVLTLPEAVAAAAA